MSNAKARRHLTGREKVAILRRHLVEKVPVSDLCEEHRIHPTLFYRWQNGKLERWHRSVKGECLRPGTPLSLEDARRLVADYVAHDHTVRLHRAIGYVTPKDKLEGREAEIFAERDRKLAAARERRRAARQNARQKGVA